jgi:hypothetical protein
MPEVVRAGVRRVRRCDKDLGVEQVRRGVTQISFNRSVAVPVHSGVASARDLMGAKRGSAWAVESDRADIVVRGSWLVVRVSSPAARLEDIAV